MTVKTAIGAIPDFFEYYEELTTMAFLKPLRRGQRALLLLYEYRPDLASRVVETNFDPFNIDARIPAFLDWLMDHWEDPQVDGDLRVQLVET